MLQDGKFEIKLGLPTGTAFPTAPAPAEGDIFYRTDEDKVYTYDGAAWNELGGGNGGSADFTLWDPNAPPTSPSAYDDEFSNSVLDGKWTEFDPDAELTVTEDEVGLKLDTASASFNLCGLYQTVPSGDFTIYARASLLGNRVDWKNVGLMLWEDATDDTKRISILGFGYRADVTYAIFQLATNYTTWNSNYIYTNWSGEHAYVRVRRNSTTYSFALSSDGLGWQVFYVGGLAFVPTHFGVGINNQGAGVSQRGVFNFFRYVASDVGLTGIMNGDRIDHWRA